MAEITIASNPTHAGMLDLKANIPFANPDGVLVCLDRSLQRFDVVYPACGSANSAIPLTCDELFACSRADRWVDVCKTVLPDP